MDRIFRTLQFIVVILTASIFFLVGTLIGGTFRTTRKLYHSTLKDGQRPFLNSNE